MSEDFKFSLELIDKISGPADKAAEHLAKIKANAAEAGKTLDYGDKAKRSAEELARLKLDPKGFIVAHTAAKRLREEQAKLIKQSEKKGLFDWASPHGLGRIGSNILSS